MTKGSVAVSRGADDAGGAGAAQEGQAAGRDCLLRAG